MNGNSGERGPSPELLGLGARDIAHRIAVGEISAREVVDAHIGRIQETHGALNAVVVPLFDEARAAADAADQSQSSGDDLGALHGVPVTIKEQYCVAGTATTLGASRLTANIIHREGPLVTALRSAGAIILGKTNIIQTLAGWESVNPVYGRTNNPWNLDRTPGGSSGGEAAVIAAGGSPLGLGGDFGGSIRVPAHFSGIHGFKPTSGRLSNADFAPGLLGNGQELFIPQPGPMARSVVDLNLAMRVFAATSMGVTPDCVAPVAWTDPAEQAIRGMRIGYYTDNGYVACAPAIRRLVTDAVEALEGAGAHIVEIRGPDAEEGARLFLRAVSAGGAADYVELLGDEKPIAQVAGMLRGAHAPAPVRSLLVRAMKRRGQHYLAGQIAQLRPSSAREYWELVEDRNRYRQTYADLFAEHELDTVVCPPFALPALTHGSSEHLFPAASYAFVYNVLGAPAGVVSIGRVGSGEETDRDRSSDNTISAALEVEAGSAGLPIGVQVVARHWNDARVLTVMAALETLFRDRPDYPAGKLVGGSLGQSG